MNEYQKKVLEIRKAAAESKMRKNAEVKTLTDEQHLVLAWLCEMRHWMHSCDGNRMFNAESMDYEKLNDFLSKLPDKLTENSLPSITLSVDPDELPSSVDYDIDGDGYDSYADWVENSGHFVKFCEEIEKLNTDIENYLGDIDKQHGTNYKPTGATRIW